MNEAEDTAVKQLLETVAYGQLPPAQTQERLDALLRSEADRKDKPADAALIDAAQTLLEALHGRCVQPAEEERRLERLKHRIRATAAASQARRRRCGRVARALAAASVLLVLVLGIGVPLRTSWFDSWSTPDAQQRIIAGQEFTTGTTASAAEDDIGARMFIVEDFAQFDEMLGFELDVPQAIGEWEAKRGSITFLRDSIEITGEYRNTLDEKRVMVGTVVIFSNMENACFAFEQSETGSIRSYGGINMYVSRNIGRPTVVWYEDNLLVHVAGDMEETEAMAIVAEIVSGIKEGEIK